MNFTKPLPERSTLETGSAVPIVEVSSQQDVVQHQIKTVIEGGHYYECKGPTTWSLIGWALVQELQQSGEETMIFIDDVHSLNDLHPSEESLPGFRTLPLPKPGITFRESDCVEPALKALEKLSSSSLSKKKRAKKKGGQWFCSGAPITDNKGFPLCVLLDLALSLEKNNMGFQKIINVLPQFYEPQQLHLRRLIKKVIPDLIHEAVLYNLHGQHWLMGNPSNQFLTQSL